MVFPDPDWSGSSSCQALVMKRPLCRMIGPLSPLFECQKMLLRGIILLHFKRRKTWSRVVTERASARVTQAVFNYAVIFHKIVIYIDAHILLHELLYVYFLTIETLKKVQLRYYTYFCTAVYLATKNVLW